MVMQAMRTGKASIALKYVLFSLLMLAMIGLVFSDIGGFFRGGVSGSDVANVGNKTISLASFDKSARRALSRMNIPPQQAYQMGIMDQILGNEIRGSILAQASASHGIQIGRAEIAKQIDAMISPMVTEGTDKKTVLNQILASQGFTENEFVGAINNEVSARLLSAAIQNGYLGASEKLADDLYLYQNEERSIEYINFPHAKFDLKKEPLENDLKTLYEALKEKYASEETRTIRVGLINQDSIKSSIEISDEKVRKAYDDDIASYQVPEQRVLEQAVAKTQDDAEKIHTLVKDGSSLKAAASKVTKDSKTFIDAQPFQKDGMLEQIKTPVFEAKKGDLLPPIESQLGWHVIKITDIKTPETKSFESVKDQIKKDMLDLELGDLKLDLIGRLEDMVAAGNSLDEISKDIQMDISEFKDISSKGAMESRKHPLDVFGDDASVVTQTAFELFEGDISQVIEFKDGRMALVSLTGIKPKSYKPYDDVKAELKARWSDEQKRMDNRKYLLELLTTSGVESRSLKDIAASAKLKVKSLERLTRKSPEKADPITPSSLNQIFETQPKDMIAVDTTDGVAIVSVTASKLPDIKKADKKALEEIKLTNIKNAQQEAMGLYLENLSKNYKVSINKSILERAYGSQEQQP
jgi:peptidyl-prolyl cis-trans isomerase D